MANGETLEMTQVQKLQAQIDAVRFNPARVQRAILQHLRDVTDGKVNVVDPSNPFVFNLEASTVNVASFMSQSQINNRKQYPVAALTPQDLYLHMSDKDYLGRFALPGSCLFTFGCLKSELLNSLVFDPATGYKKLVIPRNSTVTIHGYTFTQEYPIEIRQLAHGGLQVVYNTDNPSPVQNISTNLLNWRFQKRTPDEELFLFDYSLMQFKITSRSEDLQLGTNFNIAIPFEDQYYTARVYIQQEDLSWTEIRTTHTEQVYDPLNITAVLRVEPNMLNVNIPQIYTNTGNRQAKVRVDVYQTKGGITLDMADYKTADYEQTWKPIDPRENTIFVAPINTLNSAMVFSNDIATGGREELSFEELRERVLLNAVGTPSIPITNVQISKALKDKGYDIVPNIDVVTNRVFLATRLLPPPNNQSLITAAALSIQSSVFTMEEAVAIGTVIDNGKSITITPDTIYQNVNGKLKMVPKSAVDALKNLPPERLAATVTAGGYYFSPWHYVLQLTDNEFDVRAYYLEEPKADTKFFIDENPTTLLQVSTKGYDIYKDATGYYLEVSTQSSDEFKALRDDEVFVQIAYVPQNEKERAYQNGVLVGKDPQTGERKYRFSLATNFNVTNENGLQLKDFFMFTVDPRLTDAPLTTDFDIFYTTNRQMDTQWAPDNTDKILGKFLLPSRIAAITHEKIRVTFGQHLRNLWTQSRSFPTSIKYERYQVDVPRLYTEDVWRINPATGSTIFWENGQPKQYLEHAKGTPVLGPDGTPEIKFKAGDVIMDAEGNPIPLSGRKIYRQVDFMLAEAAYWFANDTVAVRYRREMTNILVKWITGDLAEIESRLLEQTRIYFYPKMTTGMIDVMHGSSLETTINAGQAFRVDLAVSAEVYSNEDLKSQLNRKTVISLGKSLEGEVVSTSDAISSLRTEYGTDVINVKLSGLGGDANFSVVTVVKATDRLSIRKKLVAQPDGYLIVTEDVSVNFFRHQLEL